MTFASESAGLRREIRQSISDTISFYPKVGGVNLTVAPSSARYEIRDPGGALLQSGNAVSSAVSGNRVLSVVLNPISTLAEDYQCRFYWAPTAFDAERLDIVLFDVVAFPWYESAVSLNSLQELRADIGDVLQRLGEKLALAAPENATMAGVIAGRARVELDAMLRDQIAKDGQQFGSTVALADRAVASIYIRPRLILNRERLDRVERLLAVMLTYASDMDGPDSDDESASLYRHFKTEAESAFRSIGPLRYDRSESLLPSAELTDIGRVINLRREQA